MSADKTSESQCLHPEQEAAAAEQLFSGFGPMKLARPSEPKKPEQTKEVDEEVEAVLFSGSLSCQTFVSSFARWVM